MITERMQELANISENALTSVKSINELRYLASKLDDLEQDIQDLSDNDQVIARGISIAYNRIEEICHQAAKRIKIDRGY